MSDLLPIPKPNLWYPAPPPFNDRPEFYPKPLKKSTGLYGVDYSLIKNSLKEFNSLSKSEKLSRAYERIQSQKTSLEKYREHNKLKID